MDGDGHSHPRVLKHISYSIEEVTVGEFIGKMMAMNGNINGVDRGPERDVGSEEGTSSILEFVGLIVPSRMDGNQGLSRRRGRSGDR